MRDPDHVQIRVKVVGVGGAGGNALARMARNGLRGVDFLALNTDVQALRRIKDIPSLAIGPQTTSGMGSGGRLEIGKKAIKESQGQVAELLGEADMVFITAGMGGGTGSGAAAAVAEMARRQGALTVGVVTLPFSFEGPVRKEMASDGLRQLRHKVDTLIAVENDRLLPSLKGKVSLDKAFRVADEVLSQGVQGISEIVTVPGLINVDFADVKSIMTNGGPSFMSVGEGKGRWAAIEAAHMALSNPLFDAPLAGAGRILINVRGGRDLTLGQVHEVAEIIRKASDSEANVIFGVVQERRLGKRVTLTVVATGITRAESNPAEPVEAADVSATQVKALVPEVAAAASTNGHRAADAANIGRLF